jgi:hypothetical protein
MNTATIQICSTALVFLGGLLLILITTPKEDKK